ncbi:MAG: 4-hydroxythreonine-4-phosphate dehydrogenase PdxA [Rubripirellula sp.]
MKNHHSKPQIAITVGDVAGIGPELAIHCALQPPVLRRCTPILYGPSGVLARIAEIRGFDFGQIEFRDIGSCPPAEINRGRFDDVTGRASFEAVEHAIEDAKSGAVAAIVTGPIQKEAWHLAGISFPGHTELLADRLGVADFCMMLTSPQISCVLATVHIPLARVASELTVEKVLRAIRLGADAVKKRANRRPRVTVCGLNPHAGENGLLSLGEEANLIEPAIEISRREGIEVVGPLSPDTAFTPAGRKATDVFVCMYHDQGLIPLKALAFDDAVNVTLGLPIVRTSVDHGTAMDLAWQGKANPASMLAAIEMAVELADE